MKARKKSSPTNTGFVRARRVNAKRNCAYLWGQQESWRMITCRSCIGSLPNHSMRPSGTCGSDTTISRSWRPGFWE
jgi:hypothetical protein